MELLDDSQRSRSWAKKIMCTVCKRVIRNAVQLCCCGVRICTSCIADTCPSTECNAPKPEFFRDRAFEKECMGKILLCPLQCFWRGEVCLFQVHLDKIHDADVSNLFKEDPAKETMQMEASHVEAAMSDSSSMESYNRDDERVMQTSNGNHVGSTHLVPIQVMDLQHTNQDGLILCGSCGLNVSSEKLHDHREKCYFLTEYKDVCYPHVNAIFEESGFLRFGANELVCGYTSISRCPLMSCALENTAVRNICGHGFEQMKEFYDNMVRQMKKIQQINQKMSTPLEFPDFIGRFCWKVSNVCRRSRDMENPSILSPLFCSQHGHNMRLRLDFDQPKNKLQVLIQEGENDNESFWPFRGKVNIGLLSFGQSNGVYESSLCPPFMSFSESGGNVAVSINLPSFCGSDYVCEDGGLYIKCSVQSEGR